MTSPPRVGARLEEVKPPAGRPPIDLAVLAGLVAVSLAVHLWLFTHTYTTARDSIGFAQLALQYESPKLAVVRFPCRSAADVLRYGEPPHPPGYPMVVLAVSKVTRSLLPGELPEVMLRTTQVASMIGALVLVFPSYAVGRRLFGRVPGATAAALFQLLPVSARVTSDGLTEAWYLVFLAFGLRAGVSAVASGSAGGFFWAGLCSGLAYLVRPEGLLLALTMGLIGVAAVFGRRVPFPVAVFRVMLLCVGTAIPAAPYMATIGGVTLKNTGSNLLESPLARRPAVAGAALFAANFNPETDGSHAAWALKTILKESTKTFHFAPLGFALVGAAFALGRLKSDPAVGVPLLLGALNLGVLGVLALKANYLSERHTLPLAYVGTFFATHAIFTVGPRCRPWLGRTLTTPAVAWLVYGVIVVSCVPAAMKPLHENRYGHKILGDYLREHATAEDVVIDPYNWAQFYSGRSLRGVPPDPAPARYRWAVLEGDESAHSTLTRLGTANDVKNDTANPPVVAAEWLDTSDEKKARKITLYRQDATKP